EGAYNRREEGVGNNNHEYGEENEFDDDGEESNEEEDNDDRFDPDDFGRKNRNFEPDGNGLFPRARSLKLLDVNEEEKKNSNNELLKQLKVGSPKKKLNREPTTLNDKMRISMARKKHLEKKDLYNREKSK